MISMYNVSMEHKSNIRSMEELHKFCDEFNYSMELEKPFDDMDGFLLNIKDGQKLMFCSMVPDIGKVEAVASEILGELSKKH